MGKTNLSANGSEVSHSAFGAGERGTQHQSLWAARWVAGCSGGRISCLANIQCGFQPAVPRRNAVLWSCCPLLLKDGVRAAEAAGLAPGASKEPRSPGRGRGAGGSSGRPGTEIPARGHGPQRDVEMRGFRAGGPLAAQLSFPPWAQQILREQDRTERRAVSSACPAPPARWQHPHPFSHTRHAATGKASAPLGGGNRLTGVAVWQMGFVLTPLYFPGLFGVLSCQVPGQVFWGCPISWERNCRTTTAI